MSYYEESEARRRGERDFERCHWDYARWHDNSSEGRAYRSGYEEARESREQEERRREQEEQEEREINRRRQIAREIDRLEAEQQEQEPFPEPDPMIEAIEQAVTEYQNNLAENVP